MLQPLRPAPRYPGKGTCLRTFLRLLGFLRPYRFRVALTVLLGIATVVGNVGLIATAAYLISAAAVVSFISLLTISVYLVRFFSVFRAASRYAERLVSHDVTFRLLGSLRQWIYACLAPLAPARLSAYRSGDLLSRLVKDVEELENLYVRAIAPLAVAMLVCALTFAILYPFSRAFAFVVVALLIATGVGVPLLAGALSRGLGRRQLELRAELYARTVDGVQGAQDLLAFGAEDGQRAAVADLTRKLGRIERRMGLIAGLRASLVDLMMNLAMFVALLLVIPLVAAGEIPGIYLAFLALLTLGVFEAISPLGSAFQFLGRTLGAAERLFDVADSEPDLKDPERPRPSPADHTLRFDRVSFRYDNCSPAALNDISFTLKPGGKVAVVGPSGAGKSTLVNLILRFWDPEGGEVQLGGHSLRGYAQEDVRALVGVVPQRTHVFNDTLRANMLLAKPDADAAALTEALSRAGLYERLERLPEGVDSYAGEQGARLSGGERQRLAIARAFLKDAPLLVLDEPTANLDTLTERALLKALQRLGRDRSVLLITHRLVAMEEMDEILVLDEGCVVEQGTHEQLRTAGGLYTRMLEIQRQMLGPLESWSRRQ